MDSPCIKQTVCKVLKIFQHGKYLVAYVFNILMKLKRATLGQLSPWNLLLAIVNLGLKTSSENNDFGFNSFQKIKNPI